MQIACENTTSPYKENLTITIKGIVTDAKSELPVEGVLLKIETSTGGSKSGGIYQMLVSGKSEKDGSYVLKCQYNCQRAIYLTASKFGYISWADSVKCQSELQIVNIRLIPTNSKS